MNIEKVKIGEDEFLPKDFSGEKFRKQFALKVNAIVSQGGSASIIANASFHLLKQLTSSQRIGISNAILLQCLKTISGIQAIFGDYDDSILSLELLSELSPEQMIDIIDFASKDPSAEELLSYIEKLIVKESSQDGVKRRLFGNIPGTNINIFLQEDQAGKAVGAYNSLDGSFQYLVTNTDGKPLESIDTGTYCLILEKNGNTTKIYYGTIDGGFGQSITYHFQKSSDFIVLNDCSGIYVDTDGLLTVVNFKTGKVLMCEIASEVDDVNLVTDSFPQVVSYVDSDGEFIVMEEGKHLSVATEEPSVFPYKGGNIVIYYDTEGERYTIQDTGNSTSIQGIEGFMDRNGEIYAGGDIGFDETSDGNIWIRYLYTKTDDEGNFVDQKTGVHVTGGSKDTIDKPTVH